MGFYSLEIPLSLLLQNLFLPVFLQDVVDCLGEQTYFNARRAVLAELYMRFGQRQVMWEMQKMYKITPPMIQFCSFFTEVHEFLLEVFSSGRIGTADGIVALVRKCGLRRDSYWLARRLFRFICEVPDCRLRQQLLDSQVFLFFRTTPRFGLFHWHVDVPQPDPEY